MYEPTGSERVVAIDPPLPEADTGVPVPRVVAGELEAAIAYRTSPRSGGPRVAVVRFERATIYFGGPNDEAFEGHPLYRAGLQPYEFAEILDSPWVAAMERRSRVHPGHDPAMFSTLRHFALPFHDSTFECVAETLSASLTVASDPAAALEAFVSRRDWVG